jgi:hypothetical protein
MADSKEVLIGAVIAVADVLVYKHFVGPSIADIRTADSMNSDLEKAERTGLIAGSVFTLVVAGLARSATVFAIGGITLVALDFATKHANAVNPNTGKMESTMTSGESTTYPMPDYGA